MRIDHALRHPRRARGVADGRRLEFVERWPVVGVVLVGQQALIVEHRRWRLGGDLAGIAKINPAFDRLQPRGDALGDRQGRLVEADPAVLGMIDDEGDLLLEQARVDGVQHRAGARHAVEQLEMMVRVPGERAHPVAAAHAQRQQRLGQALGPRAGVGVAVAMQPALDGARHDLGRAVGGGGMLDDARDQQRGFHDQAAHAALPSHVAAHFFATSRRMTSPRETNFSPSNWQSCMAWNAR